MLSQNKTSSGYFKNDRLEISGIVLVNSVALAGLLGMQTVGSGFQYLSPQL